MFYRKGFSRVTTQDIAASIGISKKTLYQYFPSKNEIVLAALRANFEGLGKKVDVLFDNPEMSFEARFTALLSILSVQINSISFLLIEDIHKYLPEAWEIIDTFRREKVLNRLIVLIREGQRQGFVRQSLDIDTVLFLIFNIITQVLRPEILISEGRSIHSIFLTLINLIYGGLFIPESFKMLTYTGEISKLEELYDKEGVFID